MTRQEAVAELSQDKRNLLAESDLVWVWTHGVWASKTRRRIFSHSWIKHRSQEDIVRALSQPPRGEEWKVFADESPPPAVLAAIIAELG